MRVLCGRIPLRRGIWTRQPIILIALCSIVTGAFAQPADPHKIYEERCSGCHEVHAGDFVSEKLVTRDGHLLGRKSSAMVKSLFAAGHGGLTQEEASVLLSHFAAISQSGRLFQRKCRVCHDRAVAFARINLKLKNGELFGRYTGKDIGEFLKEHGRLTAEDVETIISTLKSHVRK